MVITTILLLLLNKLDLENVAEGDPHLVDGVGRPLLDLEAVQAKVAGDQYTVPRGD